MDNLLFSAVGEALAREIVGRRVGGVVSPSALWVEMGVGRDTLVFILNPNEPVIFLSSRKPAGTKERSHFAWVLEQHLRGGVIVGAFRCYGDRVLAVVVRVRDKIGRATNYTLVAEVMGRHSNLVLINPEGKVVEPLKKVYPDMSRVRHLLPGSLYYPPPPVKRKDPITIGREEFLEVGVAYSHLEDALRKGLSLPAYGVEEILKRVEGDEGPQRLLTAWNAVLDLRKELFEGKGYLCGERCSPFPFLDGECRELPILKAVEVFFEERQLQKAMDEARGELLKALRRRRKSLEKALTKERAKSLEYAQEEADRYQRWGEVILINLNSIQKGASNLEVEDPFEPGKTISIPLQKGVPFTQVAQDYFNRASKIRKKRKAASKRLEELEQILQFLDSLLWSVESAETLDELKSLREELVKEGLLEKGRKKEKRSHAPARILPYRIFETSYGNRLLVGRHPKGNEYVTFKAASRFDLWLHVRDFPGAHVILKGGGISEEEIAMAASVAAYFSRAKDSPKVEVVYTQRRYVKRPPKAPKGFVLYSKERSIAVKPEIPHGVKEVKG